MARSSLKNSPGLRLVIIGLLTFVLLIPALMVESLIRERQNRRSVAFVEVSNKWGGEQTVGGPVLTIPFKTFYVDEKGIKRYVQHFAHFLPDTLKIESSMTSEIRHRGIYDIVLYNSKIKSSGVFSFPDFSSMGIQEKNIVWDKARLNLGISDMKGIKDLISVKWNNVKTDANPGLSSEDLFQKGVSVPVFFDRHSQSYFFEYNLNLNGSSSLNFIPVGKHTIVKMTSDWRHPKFDGAFIPETHRINENGFQAEWKILHLNREYPQQWTDAKYKLNSSLFGTWFILGVDNYQKSMRTSKYAIMFILLTFLTFFMLEILNRRSIHPIQYLLIGLALILFYSLLLSFSEHLSFALSYGISALAMIGLISAYARAVLKNLRLTGIVSGVLIILYGYLYTILQLEDYALLLGSIGLFIILAAVMYLTRSIDWFTVLKGAADPEKE